PTLSLHAALPVWAGVEGIGAQERERLRVDGAGAGQGGVDVGGAAGRGVHGRVQQRVARAEVPGDHVPRAEHGDVRDPADVQHRGALPCRVAQQQLVEDGHQRRALTAGGDIARAQVVQHGGGGRLGEAGGVADLQGGVHAPVARDVVVEGLAVEGDQVGAAVAGEHAGGGLREGGAGRGVEPVPGGDVGRGGRQHGAQRVAGGGGPGLLADVQQAGAQGGGVLRVAVELCQD